MKTKFRADDVMFNMPLFHSGSGGSIPTSALQFRFERIGRDVFMPLNEAWHSRLPQCMNAFEGIFYGAKLGEEYWAVAWWSKPVARALNGRHWYELRRMAIRAPAPKNTASRMLGWMARDIAKLGWGIEKLISYQDTAVHKGTIYKASGWVVGKYGEQIDESKKWNNWKTRGSNRQNQSTSAKNRWELALSVPLILEPNHEANVTSVSPNK